MYGSSFWIETDNPRALSSRPSEAAVIPFPSELTTPPVKKMNFAMGDATLRRVPPPDPPGDAAPAEGRHWLPPRASVPDARHPPREEGSHANHPSRSGRRRADRRVHRRPSHRRPAGAGRRADDAALALPVLHLGVLEAELDGNSGQSEGPVHEREHATDATSALLHAGHEDAAQDQADEVPAAGGSSHVLRDLGRKDARDRAARREPARPRRRARPDAAAALRADLEEREAGLTC